MESGGTSGPSSIPRSDQGYGLAGPEEVFMVEQGALPVREIVRPWRGSDLLDSVDGV